MARHEFTAAAKREMAERSNGRCEAVGGRAYGGRYDDLADGERCERPAEQFDHWPRPAHDPHPDTRTANNGVHTCAHHNQRANNKIDTPREAKIKRIRQKHGIDPIRRKHKPKPIRSRGFEKGAKQPWPSRKIPKRQA